MKPNPWFVCAIAILVVSTTALSDIVPSGEGWAYSAGGDPNGWECSPTGYGPSAGASGGSEESAWDWETASGWYSVHNTQAGNFTYYYALHAYAHAYVNLSNDFQSCCGGSDASASGSGPFDSDGHSASAYASSGMFQGQYYIPDTDAPNDIYRSRNPWYYPADTYVSTSYSCSAYGGVILYSDDSAGGSSSVSATCGMY